jgi:hypothetical protein
MKKLLCALALLSLTGCKDYGECLASHTETSTSTQYVYNGDGSIAYFYPLDQSTWVCDRWQFPEGRDK